MEATRTIEAHEVRRKSLNMARIRKWQNKSAKHVDKGLCYLDRMNTLGGDKNDQETEISFKLEKVCLCEFSSFGSVEN